MLSNQNWRQDFFRDGYFSEFEKKRELKYLSPKLKKNNYLKSIKKPISKKILISLQQVLYQKTDHLKKSKKYNFTKNAKKIFLKIGKGINSKELISYKIFVNKSYSKFLLNNFFLKDFCKMILFLNFF